MTYGTSKKNDHSRLSVFTVIAVLLITVFVVADTMDVSLWRKAPQKTFYVAGKTEQVDLYSYDDQDRAKVAATIARGSRVTSDGRTDEQEMVLISCEKGDYFIPRSDLVRKHQSCVREKELFVRTPVTIYENETDPDIAGFAAKGQVLQIEGFDEIDEDGKVNMYRVTYGDDCQGYVYGKYLVASQDQALENYNEDGEYDMACEAKYSFDLHGGKAKNLDYFPCEKPSIKGNEFCSNARAMYLHAGAAVKDKYLQLAKDSGVNAVVINIDGGSLAYESPVAKDLSPSAYKSAYTTVEEYQEAVKRYQDAGIYTIGRIACFNDEHYAKDHPEDCIKVGGSTTSWVSAYSRGAWEYKVKMAIEAVELMGFNEIQFDYVRFPESSYEWSASGNADFRNKYKEEKAQAIQNFCFYAADCIHRAGAYFSVDVFGESSNGYVTAYGQYWPAISNVVDAISSMPYTDHHGESDTWSDPYPTLHRWAKRSAQMQSKLATPAAARTWITGYNTPYWSPAVDYDYDKMKDQVDALTDAGLDGGFIPWNSSSDYDKYEEISRIWSYGE